MFATDYLALDVIKRVDQGLVLGRDVYGDHAGDVSHDLGYVMHVINEHRWASPAARAKATRRLAVVALGSMGLFNVHELTRDVIDAGIKIFEVSFDDRELDVLRDG